MIKIAVSKNTPCRSHAVRVSTFAFDRAWKVFVELLIDIVRKEAAAQPWAPETIKPTAPVHGRIEAAHEKH
jgi:hypothetical protein